jgi:hypothetical protein
MEKPGPEQGPDQMNSCDPSLNRKQFLALVIKRAGLAGAILAAPKVVDSFLVPPAYAFMYSVNFQEDTTGNHTDTG